jgi:hypothetical protein
MSTAATKSPPPTSAPPPSGKAFEIDPSRVTCNVAGFCWREFEVRLPCGATLQDLNRPDLWRMVQLSPRIALRRLDRVSVLAYDESWIAECVVSGATETGVTLAKPRVTELQARTEVLFQDGTYRVQWQGDGYAAVRVRDGQVMTPSRPNATLAERDLKALYPQRVT